MNPNLLLVAIVVLILLFAGARCDLDHAVREQPEPAQREEGR